jgi:hypothetical protein
LTLASRTDASLAGGRGGCRSAGGGESSPRFTPFWLGASVLLTLGFAPSILGAASERLKTTYEVTWQGFEIAAFETELTREPERYRLSYEVRTTGLIGWLFPFASSGSSEGSRSTGGLQPIRFEGQSRWKENDRSWTVVFDAEGRVTEIDVSSPYLADREPVPPALQVAPDPLALALEATEVATADIRREGTSFDGRRAIQFEFACDQKEILMAGANDRPDEDLICLVNGRLVAGASRRWRDRRQPDEEREPAKVWFERGILKDGYWPVRVDMETPYGAVQIRLIDLDR